MKTQPWTAAWTVFIAIMAALVSPSWAARPPDRTPPTTPTNLRVTAVSPTSVTLAWNPSSDNSGSFFYVLFSGAQAVANASMTETSYTLTQLSPATTYTFRIRARDQSLNWSAYSNAVTVTTQAANTPVTPPVLAGSAGPTHISLSWTVPPNAAPPVRYWVYQDGVEVLTWVQETSKTFYLLNPGTTHTYTVRARAGDGTFSELSNAVTVTTPAADPKDHTAPSTPTNLFADHWGDAEFQLSWTESTDLVTPRAFIRYDVYVNGELSDIQVGTGVRSINYGNFGQLNKVQVIAVDEAGNQSAPATLIFLLN